MNRPRLALRLLLLVLPLLPLLPLLPIAESRADDGALPRMPQAWLVIKRIDKRARRPFNPDAVFHRYLLDRESAPPTEGAMVEGTAGKAAWTQASPDAKGRIGGRIAWAYATVESTQDRIVMASLRNGATLFVNGTPHVGSIYGDAFAVPVKLHKGTNHVYVRGVRGAFSLTFSEPPAPVFVAPFRQTLPDLVTGEPIETVIGLVVVNATETTAVDVSITLAPTEVLESSSSKPVPIVPLGILQMPVRLRSKTGTLAPDAPGDFAIELTLRATAPGAAKRIESILVPVRTPEEATLRTFVSMIDDSVQRYGLRRPSEGGPGDRPMGLVLSLHGASVNPRGQARSYARKPDFWLFAPTNRDRFGFDWQDWGRLDAYEVLQEGLRLSGVDRRHVYLTGHSMGGHGTWHLGANDPDGFAAIAPSAGWISFDTYPGPRPTSKWSDLWHAADRSSLTRTLLDNLTQLPTYILHGTKDDNVPIGQAKEMEGLLTKAGRKPQVHYEEGKNHWWDGYPEPGTQCVDWPGFYELFRRTEIPAFPDEIHFTTVHPSIDWKHHWIEVHQVVDYGKPATVKARWDPATRLIHVTTTNVRAFKMTHPACRRGMRVNGLIWDAATNRSVWWTVGRAGSRMSPTYAQPILAKTPAACGPFKRAWTNHFVMVHGTSGNDDEDVALLEQARFDAQRWTYRANGRALLVSDGFYESHAGHDPLRRRNAILYGNRETNATLRAEAASMRHRLRPWGLALEGKSRKDVGACLVLGAAEGNRQIGIVGSSSIAASRAGFSLMLFVSGAGWPDYTVWTPRVLLEGDDGVVDAGFFDANWRRDRTDAPERHRRRLKPGK